jgi:osmotically-inducible protein OsmY
MEPGHEEPTHYLVARVGEALARDPRVGEQGIHLKLAGDKVFLTGEVPTAERKDAVTEVVAEQLPGYDVRNELVVSPPGEPSEPELLS